MHPVIKLRTNSQLSCSLLLIAVSVIAAALQPLSYSLAQGVKEVNWYLPSLARTKQLRIKGYQPRMMLRFSLPAQWEAIGDGELNLNYRSSKLVQPNSRYMQPTTTLSAYLNDQPLETVPLRPSSGSTRLKLPLKHLKPGENQLRLEALLPVRGDARCVKPENSDRWIAFSPTSNLRMTLVPRSEIPPLGEFPNQFIPLGPDASRSVVTAPSLAPLAYSVERSRVMISMPGCASSHLAKVSLRFSNKSTTRCFSRSTRMVP